MAVAAAVSFVGVLLFGDRIAATWAQRRAEDELRMGAVGPAERWLDWSGKLRPNDPQTDLLLAACYRKLGETDRCREALEAARRHGASNETLKNEELLLAAQLGEVAEHAEAEMARMIDAGMPNGDVCVPFVRGFLTRGQIERAVRVLDAWQKETPEDVDLEYMQAIHAVAVNQPAEAVSRLRELLERHPRHEPARLALARLLSANSLYDEAIPHWFYLARRHPNHDEVVQSLVELLQKTGRVDAAAIVSARKTSGQGPSLEEIWRNGLIALQQGDYHEATQQFARCPWGQLDKVAVILTDAGRLGLQGRSDEAQLLVQRITLAATALALGGAPHQADPLFQQFDAFYAWMQRVQHLRALLTVRPDDTSAGDELNRLLSDPPFAIQTPREEVTPSDGNVVDEHATGRELYLTHCTACHGDQGDGNGRAARHLYPRPPSFRAGKFRFVSTVNQLPTREDLVRTFRDGIPGSSMPSFAELSEEQLELLADYVMRLHRDGVQEKMVVWMSGDGEPVDAEEVSRIVEQLTTPGEAAAIPDMGSPSPEIIEQGRQLYDRLGCYHCHGPEGEGPSDTLLTDDTGLPTSPRSLAHEPFKGGDSAESLFLRLKLGLPGTPHPACAGVTDKEIAALVHYCRSLRREPVHEMTNYERMLRATRAWASLAPAPTAEDERATQ